MAADFPHLNPVEQLAVTYARSDVKAALQLLLTFDSRLADIVLQSSEPMIAQIKLAWWHDAITSASDKRPKGEPLLATLANIEQRFDVTTAMATLVDAWRLLAASDDWAPELRQRFGAMRAMGVFRSYATWLQTDVSSDVGIYWALNDLDRRMGKAPSMLTKMAPLPRALRPLSILAFAAARDVTRKNGARLMWHALTGR